MISIEYPLSTFKTKKAGGRDYIFDSIRKKWVILTPEEWVRQNTLQCAYHKTTLSCQPLRHRKRDHARRIKKTLRHHPLR